MSGLLRNRAWVSGVALVTVFAFAACSDDDDATNPSTAGKSSGGSAGSSGSNPGGEGGNSTAGSSTAGKAGNAGSAGTATAGTAGSTTAGTAGTATGGETMGGQGGVGGSGGDAGGAGAGGAGNPLDKLRTAMAGMSPLPAVPADTTNQYADNAAAATLGQMLFFDKNFSGALKADNDLGTATQTGKVSCASCHSGAPLIDERNSHEAIAIGTGINTRNAPAVVNSAFYTWTNWGGRFSAQWELPLAVVENGNLMAFNRLALAHRIYTKYKTEYEAAFTSIPDITDLALFPATGKPGDAAFDGMAAGDKVIINRILVNYSKAIQAYMRKLVSREAAFDKFMAGDDSALTVAQVNGAWQFVDHGCTTCHSGAHFSDEGFHHLGVPQALNVPLNSPATDDGRFANTPALIGAANLFNRNGDYSDDKNTGKLETIPATLPDSWKAAFRTPSLREVALTAPYMHGGQFATLDAVIDFYAAGGGVGNGEITAFSISAGDKADLVAFLGSLTGKALDAALVTDTSAAP
ncbi:MAG TPA: cytochrome c peroxidase [Polyangiaceae bacterium]|nr:cytochrome c peroxidase [Polyangiaceae bacterium]